MKHVSTIQIVAAIAALALIAGCGDDAKDDEAGKDAQTATATASPTETPTPTPTPESDKDHDGTSDVIDFAPNNKKVQTKADAQDCDVLGINAVRKKEGRCTREDGTKVKVVNKTTTLVLPQMAVKLNSIEPTTTIPVPYDNPLVGSFVVANVSVTNRLTAEALVSGPDMFALSLGNRTYNPDFDAMNTGSDDDLIDKELQPDETATGKLVFKVAQKRVGALDRNGNLIAVQFSDVDSEEPSKRAGIIRTYN